MHHLKLILDDASASSSNEYIPGPVVSEQMDFSNQGGRRFLVQSNRRFEDGYWQDRGVGSLETRAFRYERLLRLG